MNWSLMLRTRSCFEEQAASHELQLGLAKEGEPTTLLAMIDEEQKMLTAFIKTLIN